MNDKQVAEAMIEAREHARQIMVEFISQRAGKSKRRKGELMQLLDLFENNGRPPAPQPTPMPMLGQPPGQGGLPMPMQSQPPGQGGLPMPMTDGGDY